MNVTTPFPCRVGAPDKPAQTLAELFQNRAANARTRAKTERRYSETTAMYWEGRADAFTVAADNLVRTGAVPVDYVESVCPTTGRRDRYKLNADGTITVPFPA